MESYEWNEEKDLWLKATRGVGFEELVSAIEDGGCRSASESGEVSRPTDTGRESR